MLYTTLGRSGLEVSRLALGTMNFGWHTDQANCIAIMDHAQEAGINLFDTADIYGAGASESIVGQWLAGGRDRRDKTVLASKLFIDMDTWPNFGRLSALNIRRACEASLRRLNTDHIDLYQFHHIDRSTGWDEIWEAMNRLVQDGKIIYAGTSNFAGWHIAQASEAARRRNMLGPIAEQSVYNLLERTIELEVLPAATAYGLGLLAWSPLAGGLLAGNGADTLGRRGDGSELLGHDARQRHIADRRRQLDRYFKLAAEIGATPSTVALAWLLRQPGVTGPILGPRTTEQLTNALDATSVTLTAEISTQLDEIFPGPGGAAPEAYAWSAGQ